MLVFSLFINTLHAECIPPSSSVLSTQKNKLEGEISATIMGKGLDGGGSKDQEQVWEVMLPSQDIVDNQHYLYMLCTEYEAGRLPKSAYCEITAGIWSRIVGYPLKMEACVEDTAPPPAATATAQPQKKIERETNNKSKSGRWSATGSRGEQYEFYGPHLIMNQEVWFVEHKTGGCLSQIYKNGNGYAHEVFFGTCKTWYNIKIEPQSSGLGLSLDREQLTANFAGLQSNQLKGTWSGTLERKKESAVVRALAEGLEMTYNLSLDFNKQNPEMLWEATKCLHALEQTTTASSLFQYRERTISGTCSLSNDIKIIPLSSDKLVMIYMDHLSRKWLGIFSKN